MNRLRLRMRDLALAAVLPIMVVVMVVVMAGGGAWAQCPLPSASARDPTVHLVILEPRLIYRHDLDLVGLASVRDTFERAPGSGVILGLTKRNDELRIRVRSILQPSVDGRTCIWVDEVTARIGDPEMDVYVAANYQPGSCEYNVVLEHENRHVAINRNVVAAFGPRIGAQLRAAVRRMFPMITTNPKDAARLPQILIDAVRPVLTAMEAELRRENGAIDTPESYRQAHGRCRNWFPAGTRMPARR